MRSARVMPAAAIALALAAPGCADAENNVNLDNEDARISYSIGANFGKSFKQKHPDLDLDALLSGLRDAYRGDELKLSSKELRQSLQAFKERRMAKMKEQQAEQKKQAKRNKEKGEAFLAKNENKDEVETTDSGLQYKVIEQGDGASPDANDKVKVHYEGTLLDGSVFDSSYERGSPAEFGVSQVIPGWTEALQKMSVGGEWKLFIPSDLAYGTRGSRDIGPNETLIFKVELLDVTQQEGDGSN